MIEKIKNIFLTILDNKIALIVLSIIVGISLVAAGYINFTNPTNKIPEEIAEIDISNSATASPGFSGAGGKVNATNNTKISQVEVLPVYTFEQSSFTSEENILKIISNLELTVVTNTNTPTQGKVIVATDGTKSLSAEIDRGKLDFIDESQLNVASTFPENANIESFVQSSTDYLTNLGIDLTYFKPTKVSYLQLAKGSEATQVTSPYGANVISIEYNASINDLPIIDKTGSLNPNTINVWITPNNTVFKMYIESTGKPGKEIATVPLKTKEQVVIEINAGQAKLIDSKLPLGEGVARTLVTSGKLGYYANEGKLLPVYILEGDSISLKGSFGESYLLIDAIDTSDNE